MTALPHILVVDDDSRLRALLRKYLTDNGFRVTDAADACAARAMLAGIAYDLIILDVMMPGENGLELTESLRRDGHPPPILILTAMGEPEHRIDGFERGADDYLSKPFEPRELVLRIRALLRRTPPRETAEDIRLGACRFELTSETLTRDGDRVPLTEADTRLLKILARNAGLVISREELARRSGGDVDASARAVDVQVARLRRKIEVHPSAPRYLRTVRGKGYTLWPD